jgi:hypothetical protein
MTDQYTIEPADAGVLRPLAEEVARVAALPVQDFIFSAKPNPAFLAGDALDLRPAREQLKQILRTTRLHGCRLEIVLKDIHTLRGEPQRLAAWPDMAMRVVEDDHE